MFYKFNCLLIQLIQLSASTFYCENESCTVHTNETYIVQPVFFCFLRPPIVGFLASQVVGESK